MPHQQHALLRGEERRWFSPQQGLVHSRPWPLHASKVDLLFSTCLVWLVCFLFDIPSSQTSCVNEMLNRPSGSPPRKDESEEKEATTENVEEETTKKKKRRKKKDRTTTTTTPATTTKKEAVSTTEETEVRWIFKGCLDEMLLQYNLWMSLKKRQEGWLLFSGWRRGWRGGRNFEHEYVPPIDIHLSTLADDGSVCSNFAQPFPPRPVSILTESTRGQQPSQWPLHPHAVLPSPVLDL